MELAGAHVIVTGAARGIGEALARRFHAAGARVVVADVLDPTPVADSLDGAVAVVADVSTVEGNVGLIDAAEAAFGQVDLFFANAGVALGTDLTTSEADWQLAFDVNRQRPPLGCSTSPRRLARTWAWATSARRRPPPGCSRRSARPRTR